MPIVKTCLIGLRYSISGSSSFSKTDTDNVTFISFLISLQSCCVIIFAFARARKQINDIARKIDEELIHDDSDYSIYKQGTWEQLTELSAIHCIARFQLIDVGDEQNWLFSIEQEDLDAAKKFHDSLSRHAQEVLDEISRPSSRATSQEKDLDRIYRYIFRAGIEGIKKTDLGNSAKLLKDPLNEILDTLLGFGRIKMRVIPTKGRKLTMYVAVALLEDSK